MTYIPTTLEWVCGGLSLFFTLVSLICTICALWLILKKIGISTGYMRLIFSLSLMQMIYDLGLLFIPLYWAPAAKYTTLFLTFVGGIGSTLWSNVINFVVLHVVSRLKSFAIWKHYSVVQATIVLIGVSLGISTTVCAIQEGGNALSDPGSPAAVLEQVYYWLRFASIMFNIVAYAVITHKLEGLGLRAPKEAEQQPSPIAVLASRLKWYPVVQVVSRAGASWYELFYGFNTSTYREDPSVSHSIALLCYAVFTPLAGIGYFAIFLLMQRSAKKHFFEMLSNNFPVCFKCVRWCTTYAEDERDPYLVGDPQEETNISSHNIDLDFNDGTESITGLSVGTRDSHNQSHNPILENAPDVVPEDSGSTVFPSQTYNSNISGGYNGPNKQSRKSDSTLESLPHALASLGRSNTDYEKMSDSQLITWIDQHHGER